MDSPMQILDSLNTSRQRYERLQGRFNEFCAQILNVKNQDGRLDNYAIEQVGNKLTVEFLDRHIEANFIFSIDDDGNRKGYIQCNLISPTPSTEPVTLETISFNGEAVSDIPSKANGDTYDINNREDAVNIIVYWVSLSLKESI